MLFACSQWRILADIMHIYYKPMVVCAEIIFVIIDNSFQAVQSQSYEKKKHLKKARDSSP